MASKKLSSSPKKGKVFAKALISFFIPGGLLFLVTVIILYLKILDKALPGLALVLPFIVYGAGILLALRFKRSWLLLAIFFLALANLILQLFATDTTVLTGAGRLVFNAVSLLLPFNLYLFTFLNKRGAITLQSICFLGGILLQGGGVAYIFRYQNLGASALLEYSYINWSLLEHIPLSQPALFVYGIVFLYFLARYIRIREAIECAFFWALILTFSALVVNKIGPASSIFFAMAGLILVISVIENIYFEGFRDELTDLPTSQVLIGNLSKLKTGYTLAMIEIDHFKKLKDNHGRKVSKQIIRMVGSKLASVTGGMPFRYGDAVFLVVFPGMFVQETMPRLEKLRIMIKESGFMTPSQKDSHKRLKRLKGLKIQPDKIPLPVSIGVAEKIDLDIRPQQVIKSAEEALYFARKEGRDRISTGSSSVKLKQSYKG
jgi:diguanylate cyclase (GGDEF)-like protein